MLTIEELESACDRTQPLELSRHSLEIPELSLRNMFYPFGFPVEVQTNSEEILSQAEELWGVWEKRFDREPIVISVHAVEAKWSDCPPEPVYRIMQPLMTTVADSNNFSIADLSSGRTHITISMAALTHKSYLQFFFLGCAATCHIATTHTTPVHAGCVAINGRGVLLCGDSGAGKSTLSYACARTGWQYVSDDAVYLLNHANHRSVIGNCHQVRFRPSAAELFPEIARFDLTPRLKGKPSIELPTAPMSHITPAQTAHIDYIVFLNRKSGGTAELVPYRREVARHFMRQVLFGPPESLTVQHETIERLLSANVLELRYTDLQRAIDRLRNLIIEDR
jgi:hypothetical protein